jgi:methylglutaconyl-CoA hydratase
MQQSVSHESSLTGSVSLSVNNKIARIAFSHPKGNSLTSKMLADLAEKIHSAGSNSDVTCIALESSGTKVFCSGASFDELLLLKQNETETSAQQLEKATCFFSGFAKVIDALYQSPKITVALVNGKAVGGGVGLVSACDYALATSESSARLSELSIGIGPYVISDAVARKIGLAHFSSMSIDCKWREALWCHEHGLYSVLYPTDTFEEQAQEFVEELSSRPNKAITNLKQLMQEIAPVPSLELMLKKATITAKLALSDECQSILAKLKN